MTTPIIGCCGRQRPDHYNGATIVADRVVYDQATKWLRAEGTPASLRPTARSPARSSTHRRLLRRFVDLLRLETIDDTRLAAQRANRSDGNYTVFENGAHTACKPCADDPKKPPLWQVKAARIIRNQTERMMYFEDAWLSSSASRRLPAHLATPTRR
jgi:LPS-assembly protein